MHHTLDALFGTSLFGKTMNSYQHTLFYVPDATGTYFWDGQSGGIEGLNQDTWVVTYIAQIKTALKDVGMTAHLFCKGDDMRVVIMVPPLYLESESLLTIKNRIVKRISETAKQVGHTINIHESYDSEHYFAFSKSASCGMIELPQMFRKIQKCYGANNAFLPFLDDYIGATFSNAHSACKVGTGFVGPYFVAVVWSMFYLLQTKLYENLPVDSYKALMLVPSIVGGFPIIYLHNMFVRAESDLLSPFLGLLKYARDNRPQLYERMVRFMHCDLIDPRQAFCRSLSRSLLLADP